MHTLKYIVSGLCCIALVAAPVAAPLARGTMDEPLGEVVPDETLAALRGGIDLGEMVASFAIQRVVEIDGVVVARMQIVISNLDRLNSGGMPTISVSGPMAQIVQFMNSAGKTASMPTSAAASQLASSLLAQPAAGSTPPAAQNSAASGAAAGITAGSGPSTSGSNAGTVPSSGTQTGSMAPAGGAPANAAATAPAASTTATSTPGSAGTSVAASNTSSHVSPPSSVSAPAPTANASLTAGTKTIPIGATGQVVVLNGLPNAAAITTAVQNEVHAATIQTQTTISATLNSLAFLNAFTLANSIRQQVAAGH
jgi:hypothetical protein